MSELLQTPTEQGFPPFLKPPAGSTRTDRVLAMLEEELDARTSLTALFEDYYGGRHRLNFATARFREVFASMLAAVSDNWMPLVVRATAERLHVQAIRIGENASDPDAARIWKRNGLDEGTDLAFTESAKHGESYLLVWNDDLDPNLARITPEHPSQMIVLRAPGDRSRIIAALKRWYEPNVGEKGSYFATLWLPERVFRLQRERSDTWWKPRGDVPEEENRLGIVPVVPLVNDPHMLPAVPPVSLTASPHRVPEGAHVGLGRSDLTDVVSTQDQINKLLCDLMVASELAAFRQRWASGLEVPRDKETGEPIEPFRAAVNRLWVSENSETSFGEFQATDLSNYIRAIEARIQSIAARTRVPPHYMMGGMGTFPSGESLKSAETGLVAKCGDKQRPLGAGVLRANAIAFEIEGITRSPEDLANASVDWVTPESRTESEYVDALVKKLSIGVPVQQLWEDYGYSPDQVERFRAMLREYASFGFTPPSITPGTGQPAPPQTNGALDAGDSTQTAEGEGESTPPEPPQT